MHHAHASRLSRRRMVQGALGLGMALVGGCSPAAPRAPRPTASTPPDPASASAPATQNPYLAQPGEPSRSVKVGTAAVSGGFVQLYTALEANLFKPYGLDVELVLIPSTAGALAALSTNELQFFYGAADGTIPAMASSGETKIVADVLFGMPYVLIASPDVRTVPELRGKSVGMARVGDLSDIVSRLAVEQFGLRPNEDVEMRPLGGSQPERYQMLVANVVQGVVITPPLDARARSDGLNVLYDLADLGVPFIYSAVHAGDGLIRDDPTLVQRFVAAMAESVHYTEKHPEVARRALSQVLDLHDPAALDSAYNAYARKLVNRRLTIPLDVVSAAIDTARDAGTRVAVSGPSDVATNQFVDDLDRTGFVQQLWGAELPAR
jgi:ABC-type nitrate/sulfonate/bicarbonate transport system substrate-binding protein